MEDRKAQVGDEVLILKDNHPFYGKVFSICAIDIHPEDPERVRYHILKQDVGWIDEGDYVIWKRKGQTPSPRKLVREKMAENIPAHEKIKVTDITLLNALFILKVREELAEIVASNFKDMVEFADLLQVVQDFIVLNDEQGVVDCLRQSKQQARGGFKNMVLISLNPANPSNEIYFEYFKS